MESSLGSTRRHLLLLLLRLVFIHIHYIHATKWTRKQTAPTPPASLTPAASTSRSISTSSLLWLPATLQTLQTPTNNPYTHSPKVFRTPRSPNQLVKTFRDQTKKTMNGYIYFVRTSVIVSLMTDRPSSRSIMRYLMPITFTRFLSRL